VAVSLSTAAVLWLLQQEGKVSSSGPVVTEVKPTDFNFDGLAKLGWIAVALVAIVVVYLIVSKAIDGERNVELAWKITEKVSGKLVIKRVEVGHAIARTTRKKTA
jgi:hypothetical protein